MKKKIFVCLAAFALALSLCACGVGGSQNAGFSESRWGDDMETVITSLEGERFLPIEDVIVVMGTEVEGMTASAIYTVDSANGLTSIGYMFEELQDPAADYNALKDAITQTNGKPDTDGDLTEWNTKAETVQMSMGKDDDGEVVIVCNFAAAQD